MNPYQKDDEDGWWWHDEAYGEYGPYATKEEASKALEKYCSWINLPKEDLTGK